MDNSSDAKTEAIVLNYLTRAREKAQKEAETANERGMLYSGIFSQKLVDVFLSELRPCLIELAESYASRDKKKQELVRAGREVFKYVTTSFMETLAKLLPPIESADAGMRRFIESADIFQREAGQHLDAELAEREKQVSPRIAYVVIPLVSGMGGTILGAIIGAVLTYRLACH